jgi:hypothetical protein
MSSVLFKGNARGGLRSVVPNPRPQASTAIQFLQQLPNEHAVILLKLMDTIHDFWFDSRHGNPAQTPIIRSLINDVFNKVIGTPITPDRSGEIGSTADTFNALTTIGTRARVSGALSNFERNTADFLADKWPVQFRSAGRLDLTYDDILQDMAAGPPSGLRGGPILQELRRKKDMQGIIEINNGNGRPIKSLDASQRNTVAEFILRYLFPADDAATENANINKPRGISYDMSPGRVDDIFAGIQQTYNALYPTNFADSAGTSLQSARNRYVLPNPGSTLTPRSPAADDPNTYTAASNIYTEGEVLMQIVSNGYSHKNPYGFTVRIQIDAGEWGPGIVLDFPFSPTQTTGPSVTYLCNIIEAMESAKISPAGAAPPIVSTSGTNSKVLALQQLVQWVYGKPAGREREAAAYLVQRIALDWKREGDYGQMRAPNDDDLTCSGDILCAEARKANQKRSGFWQHGDNIVVFRFPTGAGDSPNRAMAKEYRYWAESNLSRLQYLALVTQAPTMITNARDDFIRASMYGVCSVPAFESRVNRLIPLMREGAEPAGEDANLRDGIVRVVYQTLLSTALLRALAGQRAVRAITASTEIGSLLSKGSITLEDAQFIEQLSQQVIPNDPVGPLDPSWEPFRRRIDSAFDSSPTILGLTFSRDKNNKLVTSTSIFQTGTNKFAQRATSVLFDFSIAPVDAVAHAYTKLVGIIFGSRYPPIESAAVKSVRWIAFNELRDKLESFGEYLGVVDWTDALKAFLDPYYRQDLTVPDMQKFVSDLPRILMMQTSPEQASGEGGARSAPRPSAPSSIPRPVRVLQYIDIGQRFKAICARAAQDVNAVISAMAPQQLGVYDMIIAGGGGGILLETLEYLAVEWESFIRELKSDQEYPYESSATEQLISFLFSLRSSVRLAAAAAGVVGDPAFEAFGERFPLLAERGVVIPTNMLGYLTPSGLPPADTTGPMRTDVMIVIVLAMADKVFSESSGGFTYFGNFPPPGVFINFGITMSTADWNNVPALLQSAALSVNQQAAPLDRGYKNVYTDLSGASKPPLASLPRGSVLPGTSKRSALKVDLDGGRKTHRRRGLPKLI